MTRSRKIFGAMLVTIVAAGGLYWYGPALPQGDWTDSELELIRSLWIGSLPPVPEDPSNAVANDPRAAQLGHRLFFDTRLSANGAVSCATCHLPDRHFTDGRPVGIGVKLGVRHTMGLEGAAYSPWLFWDGRADSLWSQAAGPLESDIEHGGNRQQYVRLLMADAQYRAGYEALFGPLPEQVGDDSATTRAFVNMTKAIAAYERLLVPGPARFDRYAQAVAVDKESEVSGILSNEEIAGLKLFIGKAQCMNCHNGPLFTNNEFHNTGVLPVNGELPSLGRVSSVRVALAGEFNCLGKYNDDSQPYCGELRFARTGDELIGAHKTPSLRNVALTPPYMHAGQMTSLTEIIDQYNRAPLALVGHNEAEPLGLTYRERRQLEAFLHTLDGAPGTPPEWLSPPK